MYVGRFGVTQCVLKIEHGTADGVFAIIGRRIGESAE